MYQRPQLPLLVEVRVWVVFACLEAYFVHDLLQFDLEARARTTSAVQSLVDVHNHVYPLVFLAHVILWEFHAQAPLH